MDKKLSEMTIEELQRAGSKAHIRNLTDELDAYRTEIDLRRNLNDYTCDSCGCRQFEHQEIHSHGFWGSLLDTSTIRFHAIVCASCNKVDLYKVYLSSAVTIRGFLYD